MSYVIGLTGGIGCGKSLVSRYLQNKQYPVIDADQIARQIMEPGQLGLVRVREAFGDSVIQADGTLDRKNLGEIVFNDQAQLEKLNAITHPLIRQMLKEAIQKHSAQEIVIVDVPLLFESGGYADWVDEIWVVTASLDQQLKRIMERDSLSAGQAQARIDAQWPIAKKVEMADFVIDNSRTMEQTYEQVEQRLQQRQKMIIEKKF